MTTKLEGGIGAVRLYEIYSFLVLSEELHFARAAKRLHVSPGGLSRRIHHLERALGGALLRRTTREVTLTPYGKDFAQSATRLIDSVSDFREQHRPR